MNLRKLFILLFQFKADMNQETLAALSTCEEVSPARRGSALRVLHHAHTVDRIFAANLQGIGHEFRSSWNAEPPKLTDLARAVRETDQWYIDYVTAIAPAELAAEVGFAFTDGGHGRMSREEMLAHVLTHGGYHRGEVAGIIPEIEQTSMRDVFSGYLHRSEPARRDLWSPLPVDRRHPS